MSTVGAIAPNFHEGTRSEYLAQYVFSAFGTSTPVPHSEDSGIDLHCTLGYRAGQRFHVSHYYSVQVKSNVSPIAYMGRESVRWLLGHKYPLFICYVEKRKNRVSVFHTTPVTMCYAKEGISSITLLPERDPAGFHVIKPAASLELRLGPPILEFDIAELASASWTEKASKVLQVWIEIDQANIEHKGYGVTLFTVPESYEPNELPSKVLKSVGNFSEFENDPGRRQQSVDSFFKILSQYVSVAAAREDKARVQVLAEFCVKWMNAERPKVTPAIELFVVIFNSALRHVGIRGGIRLTEERPDGNVTGYPVARIEE